MRRKPMKCNEVYENMRSISQRNVKLICPVCRESCSRILDLAAFQLKGGGWYKDGYSNKTQPDLPRGPENNNEAT